MIVYIRNFTLLKKFGKYRMTFEYHTGYSWKKMSLEHKLEGGTLVTYTGFILDAITKDLSKCYNNKELKDFLPLFNSNVVILERLNSEVFKGCTKLTK